MSIPEELQERVRPQRKGVHCGCRKNKVHGLVPAPWRTLLIDEIKLSENLSVESNGTIEGFVDLGKFTPESEHSMTCDHGLIVIFVPFTGTWHQIIGMFASPSNVKSDTLSKIILEVVVMCENAGLHFITTMEQHGTGACGTLVCIAEKKTLCVEGSTLQTQNAFCISFQISHI